MYIKVCVAVLFLAVLLFPVDVYACEYCNKTSLFNKGKIALDCEQAIPDTFEFVYLDPYQENIQEEVYDSKEEYEPEAYKSDEEIVAQEELENEKKEQIQKEKPEPAIFITTAALNLRPTPSTSGERIVLVPIGRSVEVTDFRDGEWYAVIYNGQAGYMFAEFLTEFNAIPAIATAESSVGNVADVAQISGRVEMIEWSVLTSIIPQNTPITVIDVRTRLTYRVNSFSHGSHADVFPVTPEDTATMLRAFGGSWTWTPRPKIVVVGDRMFAASMSGMPHGGGGNRGNNMNGHVCIHFLGSRTHNGNRSHEQDHQDAVREAFNTASNW